jgi:RNA polymerase sigma-70 factor, ECF subfamily
MTHDEDPFHALRPRLFGLAYRMLGSRADAEDVVQDAWLRWHRSERDALQSAEAWLVTVVTRLAIDRLRALRSEREAYVGFWLPEPLVEPAAEGPTPEAAAELASDLSVAFLMLLERLAPEERAAFLLRQVFDHDYADIAAMLGKSEAACRQIVHRAAERVQTGRVRREVTRERHRRLLERFMQAAQSGDRAALQALLSDDAEAVGDGGGKVSSVNRVLRGAQRIANLYWVVQRRLGARSTWEIVEVNGEPGIVRRVDGVVESVISIVTDGERIAGVYAVRNPDKLAAVTTARPGAS